MAKENLVLEIIIVILIVIVGWMGFDTYRATHAQKEDKTLTGASSIKSVPIQTLSAKPITLRHSYIGTVQPIHAVSVLPYITGFIDQVLVKGGQEVKKGETLFILSANMSSNLFTSANSQDLTVGSVIPVMTAFLI